MITAKNYAAQAGHFCRDLSPKYLRFGMKEESVSLNAIAKDISESVHFVVPDGGRIFDDGLRGLQETECKLPFPKITIEYYQKDILPQKNEYLTDAVHKRLILAVQQKDGIMVCGIFNDGHTWTPAYASFKIKSKWWDYDGAKEEDISKITDQKGGVKLAVEGPFLVMPNVYKIAVNKHGADVARQLAFSDMGTECETVLELIEALSCRNVSTADHQEASPVNAKRIKAGKLPFYETKMLVIDTNYTTINKADNGGGFHASPRQHLRRGHIRRLESGNVWVNSCVVGDPNKGSINKQYAVV